MGCPVKGEKGDSSAATDGAGQAPATPNAPAQKSGWGFPFWGVPRTLDQVKKQGDQASGCPSMSAEGPGARPGGPTVGPLNPLNNERSYAQVPQASQRVNLSTDRQVSSIPKSDFTPKHQPVGAEKWVYPSEQQYFNAMKSKGFNPREEDVGWILAIHNAVNEQGWTEIIKWEEEFGGGRPKLKRFMGRPKDLTPKARFLTLIGYSPPFDRHDWLIERANGEEVRYVIDFYTGAPTHNKPVSMHLDVRPALDSFEALQNRVVRQYREWMDEGRSPAAAPAGAAVTQSAGPGEKQGPAGLSGGGSS